ncbi:MAG: pseudouridine synthase [Chitinophagaceae bacterium]|jgi:23S rRNA pseudouridine2457 synthase|nr:pseudouridine synthase [Chitinophagaceae bacterium]
MDSPGPHRYFVLYKPVDMVSQFRSVHDVRLLGSIDFRFPEGTHAIGRLDKDSEGLLLLTTDKKITRLLFNSGVRHVRRYLVQVRFAVGAETVHRLSEGVHISATNGQEYLTTPCEVELLSEPPVVPPPAISLHENVQFSWLRISLTEGRFHQVRKMVSVVNHKCIRLIRESIEDIHIGTMKPGEVRALDREEFYRRLKL